VQLNVQGQGGCALRTDGTAVCWGDNYFSPSGVYVGLGAPYGIRPDGSLVAMRGDISFTLPASDGVLATTSLAEHRDELGYVSLEYDDTIGKLSLIGAGMKSYPGVSAQLFSALADAGINIEMISTSEIRISVVTRSDSLDEAVRAVHTAFGLDVVSGEAVVYGGTGR